MTRPGAPVARPDGTSGRVWAVDRNRPVVLVAWDDTAPVSVTLEHLADLLTEGGSCRFGYRGPEWCGEPTAPGHDYCTRHGGRDWPADTPVR